VLDGVTGVHVPPRSPASIARALASVLGDEGRRHALGRAGAAHARRYGWDTIAAETLAVARSMVDAAAAVRSSA
jgi:D-inositol-3-phosphate glycosyltransferase